MKKNAFTLAEILIVLALVGFLFTLTLPNLIQKQGTTKFIEKAKSTQEKLQFAFDAVSKKHKGALPLDWTEVRNSSNKSEAISKELANSLQIMSYCGSSPKGCFSPNGYKTLNGQKTNVISDTMEKPIQNLSDNSSLAFIEDSSSISEQDDEYSTSSDENNIENYNSENDNYQQADPEYSSTYVTLIDGSSVAIKTSTTKCAKLDTTDPLERPLCGVIYIDINGSAIPNMLGVDVFGFYIAGNNVLPMGFFGDNFSFSYNCLRETPKANKYNGLACTAWALKNKNMEYRKCQAGNRLSWTGSTRCDVPPKK